MLRGDGITDRFAMVSVNLKAMTTQASEQTALACTLGTRQRPSTSRKSGCSKSPFFLVKQFNNDNSPLLLYLSSHTHSPVVNFHHKNNTFSTGCVIFKNRQTSAKFQKQTAQL